MLIIGTIPTNKMIGIYRITNIISGKVYIGSSKRLLDRKTDHIRDLTNNKHRNRYLQKAFNKYGADAFSYEILELRENTENLIYIENQWIKRCNSASASHGYNIRTYNCKFNEIDANPVEYRTIKYMVVSPIGEIYKVCNINEFARQHDLDSHALRKIANNSPKHHKFWRCWTWSTRPNEIPYRYDFKEHWAALRAEKNAKNIKNRNSTQHKWIYSFSHPEMGIYIIKSLKKFARDQNIPSKQAMAVARGDKTSYQGWTCFRKPI